MHHTGCTISMSTRGKLLRQIQGLKVAYFTNKYFSIWGNMKVIVMPFYIMYRARKYGLYVVW